MRNTKTARFLITLSAFFGAFSGPNAFAFKVNYFRSASKQCFAEIGLRYENLTLEEQGHRDSEIFVLNRGNVDYCDHNGLLSVIVYFRLFQDIFSKTDSDITSEIPHWEMYEKSFLTALDRFNSFVSVNYEALTRAYNRDKKYSVDPDSYKNLALMFTAVRAQLEMAEKVTFADLIPLGNFLYDNFSYSAPQRMIFSARNRGEGQEVPAVSEEGSFAISKRIDTLGLIGKDEAKFTFPLKISRREAELKFPDDVQMVLISPEQAAQIDRRFAIMRKQNLNLDVAFSPYLLAQIGKTREGKRGELLYIEEGSGPEQPIEKSYRFYAGDIEQMRMMRVEKKPRQALTAIDEFLTLYFENPIRISPSSYHYAKVYPLPHGLLDLTKLTLPQGRFEIESLESSDDTAAQPLTSRKWRVGNERSGFWQLAILDKQVTFDQADQYCKSQGQGSHLATDLEMNLISQMLGSDGVSLFGSKGSFWVDDTKTKERRDTIFDTRKIPPVIYDTYLATFEETHPSAQFKAMCVQSLPRKRKDVEEERPLPLREKTVEIPTVVEPQFFFKNGETGYYIELEKSKDIYEGVMYITANNQAPTKIKVRIVRQKRPADDITPTITITLPFGQQIDVYQSFAMFNGQMLTKENITADLRTSLNIPEAPKKIKRIQVPANFLYTTTKEDAQAILGESVTAPGPLTCVYEGLKALCLADPVFNPMPLPQATVACEQLGQGFRLPSKIDWDFLQSNIESETSPFSPEINLIPNIAGKTCWSSTASTNGSYVFDGNHGYGHFVPEDAGEHHAACVIDVDSELIRTALKKNQ